MRSRVGISGADVPARSDRIRCTMHPHEAASIISGQYDRCQAIIGWDSPLDQLGEYLFFFMHSDQAERITYGMREERFSVWSDGGAACCSLASWRTMYYTGGTGYSRKKGADTVRPLQISPDTAVKLAEALNVPLERLMHMPQHILLQKMMELAKQEKDQGKEQDQQK